jgi:hypothetical protein
MLASGDSVRFKDYVKYIRQIVEKGGNSSGIIYEYMLFNKIRGGYSLSQEEAEHMLRLYQSQQFVTARTKDVVEAAGAGKSLAENLIVFEWVKADSAWLDVEADAARYEELIGGDSLPGAVGDYTYVFDVGFNNSYLLSYTENGKRQTKPMLRGLAQNEWQRMFIFGKAWDYIDGKKDASADFLLLAGRVCVDSNIFEADVLFEYVELMCGKPEMRAELSRALVYVLASRNALAKACMYALPASGIAERVKRFFSSCFVFWPDVKKNVTVREFFAFIKSLERIAGANKLGGLYDYLVKQIMNNPHIKPDLSEEFKQQYMGRV